MAGALTGVVLTVSGSFSGSLSFASTPGADTFSVPPSATVSASSTANGGSFTAVTVMFTVAVALPPFPSLIWYSNASLVVWLPLWV